MLQTPSTSVVLIIFNSLWMLQDQVLGYYIYTLGLVDSKIATILSMKAYIYGNLISSVLCKHLVGSEKHGLISL